jgi:hypothetical protein
MADLVPVDPSKPDFDVLVGKIGTRTHYIHEAMAAVQSPLTPAEIGERARTLAEAGGYVPNEATFASETTRSHLVSMRDKPGRGFAEDVGDGRWQLTSKARVRIASEFARQQLAGRR